MSHAYFRKIKEKEKVIDLEGRFKEERAIVVEDDETLKEILMVYLKNFFNDVIFFEDVNLAEKYLEENKVDAIISDYFLPENVGTVLAKKVQENKKIKNKPRFILCSGDMDSIEDNDSNLKYVDSYLMKPYTLENLENSIMRVFVSI